MFKRRTRLKAKPRDEADKVTPEMYQFVMERDHHRCQAPLLDPQAGECRSKWSTPFDGEVPYWSTQLDVWLTLDHVPDRGQNALGKRAASDPAHLIVICWGHHLGGWATSHRDLERDHLQRAMTADYGELS